MLFISHRRFITLAGVSMVSLAGLMLAAGCKQAKMQMPPRPPAPVTVAVAESRDVPVYIDEIGRTVASEFVNIQPQVTGQIMRRHFVDGADLKIGDPLFTIDQRTYQAQVQQAEANLEQAKAQLELADAEFRRYEKAYQVGAASREDYDTRKGRLDTTTAQVKVYQAMLDTTRLTLNFCEINSPTNGRAGQRLVDVGNIVKANETSLVMIQRISPIYVDFTITERDLPEVRDQMTKGALTVLVSLPQSQNDTRSATVTFLDSSVQEGAGRIRLRATLTNEDRYFWPGLFVNVRLVLRTIPQAVLVPFQCTQIGQQGPFVYVVTTDMTAAQRPVTLGQRQGDLIVLAAGVNAGERIVQTGQLAIGPGAKVRELPAPNATEVPAAPQTTPPTTRPETGK